jgi:phage shock protein E
MTPAEFLSSLDNSMVMKTGEWLEEQLKKNEDITLIDLRGREAWSKEHIEGSVNVSIQELPQLAETVIKDSSSTVLCICNCSIQSAMATMFLRTMNYNNSFNLSGGFSSWKRNNRPVKNIQVE